MALMVRDEDEQVTICDADLDGVEDGDPDTWYTIRVVPPKKYQEIQQRHTKRVLNKFTHRKEDVVDDEAFSADLLDHLLVSWTGIIYKRSGEPVPCTRETKQYCLTGARVAALMRAASINETEAAAARAASFRRPPDVGDVVGG